MSSPQTIEKQKGNLFPSHIINFYKDVDTLYFHTNNKVALELTVLRDSVLRFRYTTTGTFDNDFSYAITKYASTGYNKLQIEDLTDSYVITTSKLVCHVSKADLRVKIYDAKDGTLLNEDEIGFHWEESYEYGGNHGKANAAVRIAITDLETNQNI